MQSENPKEKKEKEQQQQQQQLGEQRRRSGQADEDGGGQYSAGELTISGTFKILGDWMGINTNMAWHLPTV